MRKIYDICIKMGFSLLFFCLVGFCSANLSVYAAVLYEYSESTEIAKGVVYTNNRQVTTRGLLDVHILSIPLNDPYLQVGPAESQREIGLKETATALLTGTQAIAGVNGDFFGAAGSHSLSFGPTAFNGQLHSITKEINKEFNEFATFFLDKNNNPFMQYLRADIRFYNNGYENIKVSAYNKVTDMVNPVVLTAQTTPDTTALDNRFPGQLLKVLVENNIITYVSAIGETITIPPGAYAVVIGQRAAEYQSLFAVGQFASLQITNNLNIDFSQIQAAIGGGGLILSGGQTVHDRGTAVAGRHPRTAIGISGDKKRLILMVVDGRSHSIGATHDEMAALLLRFGAADAMHLDGGGSSTMVVQFPGNDHYAVVNTLSEGTQRRIINALAVYNTAPVGEVQKLVLTLADTNLCVGTPLIAEVYGLDAYARRIPIAPSEIKLSIGPTEGGLWNGNTYLIDQPGYTYVEARYNHMSVRENIQVINLAELRCENESIRLVEGMTADLSFTAIGSLGETARIPAEAIGNAAMPGSMTVTVSPPHLGYVENGVFYAKQPGFGYMQCTLNDISTFVPLTVGGIPRPINAFDTLTPIYYAQYPDWNTGGSVSYLSAQSERNTMMAQLTYSFIESNDTQASYLTFHNPVKITGQPFALRMQVFGDGSGHWLRGQIKDAKGSSYNIDFAKSVDFVGWQSCVARLPAEAVAPFTLERIYMVTLSCETAQRGSVYFFNPEALLPIQNTIQLPEAQRFTDPLHVSLTAPAAAGAYDINLPVSGKTTYAAYSQGSAAILQLTAAQGGLYATNATQWANLVPDLNRANPHFIIIQLDTSPDAFTYQQEAELLHQALLQQKTLGRNVFVVFPNTAGRGTTCDIIDGIRYIGIDSGMATTAYIRFRINGQQIQYDVAK